MTSAIDRRLADAKTRVTSVTPAEARRLHQEGALFVDTRRTEQRTEFGEIPGAQVIDRNVIEWRLDPTSEHRDAVAATHQGPIVVFCQQGFSSVLVVDSLRELGVPEVYDLGGGFDAWAAAGLPVKNP